VKRRRVYERGTVPCQKCGKPHDYVADDLRSGFRTWAAEDGHAYYPMTAEEVVRFVIGRTEELRLALGQGVSTR
jgi:hypothetical protein